MPGADRVFFVALACNLLLGVAVFFTNTQRPTGRSFLLMAGVTGGWLMAFHLAFAATTAAQAAFWIRVCAAFGAMVMPTFALLRVSIIYYRERWGDHLRRLLWWYVIAFGLVLLEFSPNFVMRVTMIPATATQSAIPEPTFGWVGNIEAVYVYASLLIIGYTLIRDQFSRRVQGVHRIELQFVLLACSSVIFLTALTPILKALTGSDLGLRFAPLRAVTFYLIIAYGITSRGILHVQAIFRLTLSYVLLAIYTAFIFTVAWFVFQRVFVYFGSDSTFVHAMSVAIFTALLFNATGTPLRRLTKRILPPEIDFERIVTNVSNLTQSMSTLQSLFERFALLMGASVGGAQVRVLLLTEGRFEEQVINRREVENEEVTPISLSASCPLFQTLHAGAADVATEELHRLAPSAQRDALLAQMEAIDASLFVPIRYQDELTGALIFAPRPSGHVYGSGARATLRLIARQLGVAIANSRLYTEARQSQAYNQFLVEHLTCGVIATDPQGELTVVNPEARRLLGLDEEAPPPDLELPQEIARLIPPTIVGDFVGRDEEIILREGARDEVNLRVSCLPFASESNRLLGAVLVMNDYSAIERLQRQIRQADRLASIGTLASGMAHEIKNPLTALKTFTQLLPKRYSDPEFRNDFAVLGGSEIQRIERIVNDLLAFARPAPLIIEAVNVHDVVSAAARLTSPQAAKQHVELRTTFNARTHFIAADRDRLQQVLLNLILNAIQASEDGGWVELSTESEPATLINEASLRLDVRDGGRGISKEMLPHIFDPFFTTKSEGTGLGLSVSYNIIAEHKGRLEVASESGEGTCFSIYLPLAVP